MEAENFFRFIKQVVADGKSAFITSLIQLVQLQLFITWKFLIQESLVL